MKAAPSSRAGRNGAADHGPGVFAHIGLARHRRALRHRRGLLFRFFEPTASRRSRRSARAGAAPRWLRPCRASSACRRASAWVTTLRSSSARAAPRSAVRSIIGSSPAADQPARTSSIPNTRAISETRSRVLMEKDATVVATRALSAHSAQQTRCPLTRSSRASYIRPERACVASLADGLTFTGEFDMAKVQGEGDYESARRYNTQDA